MSSATSPTLRPLTSATTSSRRETASRWITRRRLADPHVGDVAEADVTAAGPVDQQVADVVDAAARLRRALDDDVEDLLLLEHAADLDALEQRGLRAAHVARA